MMTQPKPAPKRTRRPGDKYLSDTDLAARYAVHRATPWRWAAAGNFPKPVQLSPGCTRWVAAEVEAHDVARAAARDTAAA